MYSTRAMASEQKPITTRYTEITSKDLEKFKKVNEGKDSLITDFFERVISNNEEYAVLGLGEDEATLFYLKDKHFVKVKSILTNGISTVRLVSKLTSTKINPYVSMAIGKIEENQSDISNFITRYVEPNLEIEEIIETEKEYNFGNIPVAESKLVQSTVQKKNIFGLMKNFGVSDELCNSLESFTLTGFDGSFMLSVTTEAVKFGSKIFYAGTQKTEEAHKKIGQNATKDLEDDFGTHGKKTMKKEETYDNCDEDLNDFSD